MEKIYLSILFLGCVILPISPAIANILFLTFSGIVIIHAFVIKEFPNKKDWLNLLVLPSFFFLWMLIGMLFSSYKKEAFRLIEISIPFLTFSLAYIFASKSLKQKAPVYIKKGFIVGVSSSILYLGVMLLIRFYNADNESLLNIFSHTYTYYNFTFPINTHPTYYTVWILCANYFVFQSKTLRTPIKVGLLLLFCFGIIFSMSRVGVLLYGIQIFVSFFFLSKTAKIIYALCTLLVIFTGIYLYKYHLRNMYLLQRLSIELAWDTNPENTESEINNRVADDSRTARWLAILETIKKKPISGYGVGSERTILDKTYSTNDLNISLERKYNTHNQYLFYMLEQGIIGLFLFLSYFFINLVLAIKRKDFFVFSFIVGIMIVFMFENYLYRSMGYLTVALLLTFMRTTSEK